MNQFLEQIVVGAKVDTRGFKQADSALGKLNRNVKTLAKSFGIAYGTAALVSYGKAAVKAFADDEAAAKRLAGAVNNLGIGFANPAISEYIAKLEKSAAIADDILRPAFQGLLTTTGSLTQSQKLLNDAITISRASGMDLATVADDLAKGYVGITKGLSKYNTGLTKAELTSKSFADILDVLLKRSAGAAQDYLTTTSYKFDVLSVASQNASEIIGGGLVDAFALLAGGTDAKDAATAIETIAKGVANLERVIGRTIGAIPTLISNLKNLPKNIFGGFAGKQGGINTVTVEKKKTELTVSQKRQQELLAKLESAAVKRNKELLLLKNKQLATDKLKFAIEKANLALGKGNEIFNMDAIELNAALINQTEQLGKATTSTQVLAIANDIARLKVKQDILALEDAIASGDEKAITAATDKLNADMKILNTLQQQNVKLVDIKSLLESLKPKDLVNQSNLDDALTKLKEMLALLSKMGTGAKTVAPVMPSGNGRDLSTPAKVAAVTAKLPASVSAADFFATLTPEEQAQLGGYVPFKGANIPSSASQPFTPSSVGYGISGTGRQVPVEANFTFNINAGAIANPDELTGIIQDSIIRINKQGDYLTTAGAL